MFVTEGKEKADGRSESWNYEAGEREGVRSLAICGWLPLLFGGGMERLWRAQAQSERKVEFFWQEEWGKEASNGVVCGSIQVSMYEMWNRKQIHEDARKMHRTKIPVKKFGKVGRRHLGGHDFVTNGQTWRGAESVPDTRDKEMGPKLMNCCKPEEMGTKRFGRMLKRIQTLEEGRVPAKETKSWRIEVKGRELRERSIRGFWPRLKWKVWWHKKRIVELGTEEDHDGKRRVAWWKRGRGERKKKPCMMKTSGALG